MDRRSVIVILLYYFYFGCHLCLWQSASTKEPRKAERWSSAAARDQHSSWRKEITWEARYRAVSCKALLGCVARFYLPVESTADRCPRFPFRQTRSHMTHCTRSVARGTYFNRPPHMGQLVWYRAISINKRGPWIKKSTIQSITIMATDCGSFGSCYHIQFSSPTPRFSGRETTALKASCRWETRWFRSAASACSARLTHHRRHLIF